MTTAPARSPVGEREPGSLERSVRGAWTLLRASDPGLVRLRTAATTLLALATSLGVLTAVMRVWGQPVTSALLGVVVAMISSVAVRGEDPRARGVTVALMVPVAGASVSLAAVLSSRMLLGDGAFVLVIVGAVLLRRLGPRGAPVGFVAFIGYFFALFLGATPGQLPPLLVSVVVGAGVSWTVRTLLRPRHPYRDLRRVLAALGLRAGAVFDVLATAARSGSLAAADVRRLDDRLRATAEAALMVEQRLEEADGRLVPSLDNDAMDVRVVDLQLAVERVAALTTQLLDGRDLPGDHRARLAEALETRHRAMHPRLHAPLVPARTGGGEAPDDDPGTADLRRRLVRAVDRFDEAWTRVRHPGAQDADDALPERGGEDDEPDRSPGPDDPDDPDERRRARRETAREALQVGVAAVGAIVVGELLSPARWFWAVIATFVVFIGTSTREETLRKGWQRVVGTLAGVVAGVLVGALVGGDVAVSLVLVGLCLFGAVFMMPVSQGVTVFFFTTLLALLYGLLGTLTVDLLVLRLEETAAGAAVGVAVAFLVLPARSRTRTDEQGQEALHDLAELLRAAGAGLAGDRAAAGGAARVLDMSRSLRDAVVELRTTARPVTGGLLGRTRRSGALRTVRVLGVCEHHARALTRVVDRLAGGPSRAAHPGLGDAAREVAATADAVAAAAAGGRGGDRTDGGEVARPATDALDAADRRSAAAADDPDALPGGADGPTRALWLSAGRHLRAVDEALRELVDEGGRWAQGGGERSRLLR
ncbi:FUSC family protein [Pseudokineococcus basanitobsidens]|uniref:FUSC family protein n=1 Tax=Pseudokineococcus basanitobsidens TaxID=1926649 RepID=A0ABU8RFT2_9ACTN